MKSFSFSIPHQKFIKHENIICSQRGDKEECDNEFCWRWRFDWRYGWHSTPPSLYSSIGGTIKNEFPDDHRTFYMSPTRLILSPCSSILFPMWTFGDFIESNKSRHSGRYERWARRRVIADKENGFEWIGFDSFSCFYSRFDAIALSRKSKSNNWPFLLLNEDK